MAGSCALNFGATDLPHSYFEASYPKVFRASPEVDLVSTVNFCLFIPYIFWKLLFQRLIWHIWIPSTCILWSVRIFVKENCLLLVCQPSASGGRRVQAAEAYRRWRAGPTPAPSTVACSDVTASPANDLGTLRHQLHHREHQMPGHRSSDHRQTIMHAVVV